MTMEDSKRSHSASLGIVPNPQDPKRNIQLVGMGLPSTLDDGTRKSKPLLEGTHYDPKDSSENDQSSNKGLPSTASMDGIVMTSNNSTVKDPVINDRGPHSMKTALYVVLTL
nr:hypothetical protein [Tanacetum cinerariifolium]